MKEFKAIVNDGYCGQLVFVKVMRNILWDENLETETFEYEKKMKPGFILNKSNHFEGYYLIRFFSGEKEYHWGTDIFKKNEESNLTYLKK